MFVILFAATTKGCDAVLGENNPEYIKHLSAKQWFDPKEMEILKMHQREGVSTYYIGEDVLYMFDESLDLLSVLSLLVQVAVKELGNDNRAVELSQKLLGCNNGTRVHVNF